MPEDNAPLFVLGFSGVISFWLGGPILDRAAFLRGLSSSGIKKWDVVRSASMGIHFRKADRLYVYADPLSFGGAHVDLGLGFTQMVREHGQRPECRIGHDVALRGAAGAGGRLR
jgi:hypothetical protein